MYNLYTVQEPEKSTIPHRRYFPVLFDTIFLVRGWQVEDHQNNLPEVPILPSVIFFSGVVSKRKSTEHNQEYKRNWNNKFEILSPTSLLTLYENVLDSSTNL